MLSIVIFNGGRGASAIIPQFLNDKDISIYSIVNAYDDGKSTGEIRKFFNMLGPSDIRKVQELFLPSDSPYYEDNLALFRYRYPQNILHSQVINDIDNFINNKDCFFSKSNSLDPKTRQYLSKCLFKFKDSLEVLEKVQGKKFNFEDCSIMNCIYAGAFILSNRDLTLASQTISSFFNLNGNVLPTNIENKKLVALREDGQVLYSEAEIVELRSNVRIEKIFLLDHYPVKNTLDLLSHDDKRKYLNYLHSHVPIAENVSRAIKDADIIIYSSGTQHSSLYPTYFSEGLADAISSNTSALKFFICNIGADYETPSYMASDFYLGALKYLQFGSSQDLNERNLFTHLLINQPSSSDDYYVINDISSLGIKNIKILEEDFESKSIKGKHNGSMVKEIILSEYKSKFI